MKPRQLILSDIAFTKYRLTQNLPEASRYAAQRRLNMLLAELERVER